MGIHPKLSFRTSAPSIDPTNCERPRRLGKNWGAEAAEVLESPLNGKKWVETGDI